MTAPPTRADESTLPRRRLLTAAATIGTAGLTGATAACSGPAPSTPVSSGVEGVTPVELGEPTPGIAYPDDYVGPTANAVAPFGDAATTFRVVVPVDAQVVGDWNDNEFTRWFAERTGVQVEFDAVLSLAADGSVDLTKINAMISAGDLPDAFLGVPLTDDQISLYGQQGLFVPLDDLITTYAPQLRRALQQYPDLGRINRATDGRTYQFRGVNDCYHCHVSAGRAYVNQAYLDKIGATVPTTTEELRAVLRELKEQDPTGTGRIIPFGAGTAHTVDRFIMNAFLVNPGGDTSGGWLTLDGEQVRFVANRPEWREALRYLRSLFDDGTITRETFTMTADTMLQAGNQGRFGVVRAYFWGSFVDVTTTPGGRWEEYVSLPPLTGPAGVRWSSWDHYAGYRGSSALVITNQCRDPATLVRWADAQVELEATVRAYGGRQGDNWRWSDPGQTGIDGDQAIYTLDSWPAPAGTTWNQVSVMYRSNDFRLGQYADPDAPNLAASMYAITPEYEKCRPPVEQQLPPLIFEEADAGTRADIAVSVANHVTTSLARFAIGELEIDDDRAWDDYVATFDRLGLPAYLDLHQRAYDRRPR